MEGTYSTSDYINNIMLKKILGKNWWYSEKPKNYLGMKKYFAFS